MNTYRSTTNLACLLPVIFASMLLFSCDQNSDSAKFLSATMEDSSNESMPGAQLTRKKCESCHHLDRNLTKVGPSLKGIVGRAPKISDVPYEVWDKKSLSEWIENPNKIKPGTRMSIPGIKSAQDRQAIVDYLAVL